MNTVAPGYIRKPKQYKVEDLDYEKAVRAHGNNRYALIVESAMEYRQENRKKNLIARDSYMKPLFDKAESAIKK